MEASFFINWQGRRQNCTLRGARKYQVSFIGRIYSNKKSIWDVQLILILLSSMRFWENLSCDEFVDKKPHIELIFVYKIFEEGWIFYIIVIENLFLSTIKPTWNHVRTSCFCETREIKILHLKLHNKTL